MAKSDTFSVSSKKSGKKVKVSHKRKPETIAEFTSLKLVSKEEDVIDLAYQNWVIKAQSGARQRLGDGEEAVQKYVNEYTYGARTGGGGARKSVKLDTDQIKQGGFSEEQLAMLKSAGVSIPGQEDEAEEETGGGEEKATAKASGGKKGK